MNNIHCILKNPVIRGSGKQPITIWRKQKRTQHVGEALTPGERDTHGKITSH